MRESSRDSFVHILLSFALGGLLGDVFFHTLPHMMESDTNNGDKHDHHNHNHGHVGHHHHSEEMMQKNIIIIVGLMTFFLIEKIIHNYFGGDHHAHSHEKDKSD